MVWSQRYTMPHSSIYTHNGMIAASHIRVSLTNTYSEDQQYGYLPISLVLTIYTHIYLAPIWLKMQLYVLVSYLWSAQLPFFCDNTSLFSVSQNLLYVPLKQQFLINKVFLKCWMVYHSTALSTIWKLTALAVLSDRLPPVPVICHCQCIVHFTSCYEWLV